MANKMRLPRWRGSNRPPKTAYRRFKVRSEFTAEFISLIMVIFDKPYKPALRWANKNFRGMWVRLGAITEDEYVALENEVTKIRKGNELRSRNALKRRFKELAQQFKED